MLDLDRRAVEFSVAVVAEVRADQWDVPSPCAQWTLAELVAHMIAHNRGFAAAARGETTDVAAWRPAPLGADPSAEYAASAREVIAAFGAPGVLSRELCLPEISTSRTFPARQAISFHFLDYVVHGWDVAASVGLPVDLDTDLLTAAMEVARREVPVGRHRERPGAAFAPVLPVADDAPLLHRLLAVLGRSPDWCAS